MRLPMEMQGGVRTRLQAWRFLIIVDYLMVCNMIWRTLMHVGRVAGRRAQRSACRHVIACKFDVMLDVLRAGLQLPVCVWLALLLFLSGPSAYKSAVQPI